jgi:hypothetical protein
MFPNKRESKTSPSASSLEMFLQNVPESVTVNMPSDDLSLYDLAGIVDVVVNATSTTGLELLTLGIPVVNHCPENLFAYPAEFNYTGITAETYAAAILKASEDGWSIDNAINAFRFRSFLFDQWSISMHDAVPSRTRVSILRVATWMCLRRNIRLLKTMIKILQKLELRRCPQNLRERQRIFWRINHASQDMLFDEGIRGRSEDEERLLVRDVLNKVGAKHYKDTLEGTLGSKIRTNN